LRCALVMCIHVLSACAHILAIIYSVHATFFTVV
jgi:hypothetical protein